METEIQRIRELEKEIFTDFKNVNNLVEIRKIAANVDKSKDVRVTAIHAFRRIVVTLAEEKKIARPSADAKSKASDKVYSWFIAQYQDYLSLLCGLVSNVDTNWAHELAVRTVMELTKFDHMIYAEDVHHLYLGSGSKFGVRTFRQLLDALILGPSEIDVDLLLMLKDEYFTHSDITYYSLLHIQGIISKVKEGFQALSKSESSVEADSSLLRNKQNLVDVMRVLAIPANVEAEESFYMPVTTTAAAAGEDSEDGLSDDEPDSDDDSLVAGQKNNSKKQQQSKTGSKRKLGSASEATLPAKRSRKQSEAQRLQSPAAYQKLFSRCWLSLLSLPFSSQEHKVLLKHLPVHVLPFLVNPLLLADYLSQSYACGGVVGVLALESLFQLIAVHNLDYPQFFLSLYKLCTIEVFNAKYARTFLKLLSAALKSSNLPAYLVAAFIKRLAHLALHASSTKTSYCITQITWLLKQNRPCQVLIQRSKALPEGSPEFDNSQEVDLEQCHALQSSLWELPLLEQHHVQGATELARAVRDPESTSVGAFPISLERYMGTQYAEMFEEDLNKPKGKKNAELAFRKPSQLTPSLKVVGKLFG